MYIKCTYVRVCIYFRAWGMRVRTFLRCVHIYACEHVRNISMQ